MDKSEFVKQFGESDWTFKSEDAGRKYMRNRFKEVK
jgi:hypothetical protein